LASDATILIVDDEAAIAALLRHTVEKAGWRSAVARSGTEGLERVRWQRPSLMLLDWLLPDCRGDALLMQIRADADPDIRRMPVIMLTAAKMPGDCSARIEDAADACISKPFSPGELALCIRTLLRHKLPQQAQSLLIAGDVTLDPIQRIVSVEQREVALDPVEFRLLEVFLLHPGKVFSCQQLLAQAWGMHAPFDDRTVASHVRRLRKKLQNAQNLIRTVRNGGYMLAQ